MYGRVQPKGVASFFFFTHNNQNSFKNVPLHFPLLYVWMIVYVFRFIKLLLISCLLLMERPSL